MTKAIKWWSLAAEKGHPWAQHNLGDIYFHQKKYKKAHHLWEKAAVQGDEMSQNSLASLYDKGLGVEKDVVKAYAWWHIAALGGVELAEDRRDLLLDEMTSEQTAQAKKLASEYNHNYREYTDHNS